MYYRYFSLTDFANAPFFKSFLYAFIFPFGTFMIAFFEIPLNVPEPTDFNFLLFLKSIVFRLLSLANTFFPILESEAPVTTEWSFLQPLNAPSSITLTFFPILTLVTFILFLNAFFVIFSTLKVYPSLETESSIVIFFNLLFADTLSIFTVPVFLSALTDTT